VFRHEIGLSPKEFCAIQRFRRVLAVIDRAARMDWTDIAASCGYFDQAHFNHDFRRFTGVSPTAYVRNRTSQTHIRISE
jgi:AraC-like DNA-binding protein